jgi:D-amino peptidase
MKFIIAVDCEGVAGVVGNHGKGLGESPNMNLASKQAVRETNAAAQALFDEGAEEVIIWDNHNGSLNLNYEEVDIRCSLLIGTGSEKRCPLLTQNGFSGMLLIGYHAMEGTSDAVLAHSFSSKAMQGIEIDGKRVGEIAIDAAIAGEVGVPVIFVSSDDKGCREAQNFLPWIEVCETKTGFGWNMALSKHPLRVTEEIYKKVRQAVSRLSEMKFFCFPSPAVYRVRYQRMDAAESAANRDNRYTRIDSYTIERSIKSIRDIY